MARILIIDDEPAILESLEMFLVEKGHEVATAATAREGLDTFAEFEPKVVILDIRLPDLSGFEVLDQLNQAKSPPKVIMITAFHDMETTIRSIKHGAYDYIHKPLDADEVEKTMERALRVLSVEQTAQCLPAGEEKPGEGILIGDSQRMLEVFKIIGVLCRNRATALIQGETGTGKELIARVIHNNSLAGMEPFMTMDCSAVVETLIESELFGHEKGAFTGAIHIKKGKIELAGSGTLFLDEVGELPPSLQGKFLGFLERREYMRVGGHVPLRSRCRIIAATNRDLTEMTQKGLFRKDLYYRLKVVTITVPPLRERIADIPDLAYHFLRKIHVEMHTGVMNFQPGVIDRLMAHPWSGNVRELENVILSAAVSARSNVILVEDIDRLLKGDVREGSESTGPPKSLSLLEKNHLIAVLDQVGWIRAKAARILGISLPTLRSKMRKYQIDSPDRPDKTDT
jgi:two-component system, NtrC family, response regulator AtoC